MLQPFVPDGGIIYTIPRGSETDYSTCDPVYVLGCHESATVTDGGEMDEVTDVEGIGDGGT